jgi:hypothetical protein
LEGVSLKSGRGRVKNVRSDALAGAEGISSKVHCSSTSKLQTQLLWKIVAPKADAEINFAAYCYSCRVSCSRRMQMQVGSEEEEKIEEEKESLRLFESARGRGYSKKSKKSTGGQSSRRLGPRKYEMCLDELGSSQ